VYDSRFEAGQAQELELRVKAGDIKSFETHQPIELIVNGYKITTYYVDFIIYHNDDSIEYLETKGYLTPIFSLKWKLFEALYSDKPDVKITMIMQGRQRVPHAKKLR